MTLRKITLGAILAAAVSFSFASGIDGHFKNNQYENSVLGMNMPVPSGWHINSTAKMAKAEAAMNSKMKSGTFKANNLFYVSKKPDGAPYNIAIMATAVKPAKATSAKAFNNLLATNLGKVKKVKYTVKNLGPVNIGGVTFYQTLGDLNLGLVHIYQHFYTANRKGYLLKIMTIYAHSEDGSTADSAVKTMRFK